MFSIIVFSANTVRVSLSAADLQLDSEDEGVPAIRRKKHLPISDETHEKNLISQINIEMLETIKTEVRNLRKVCASGTDPKHMSQRMALLKSIRLLTKHRREISDVYEGSVIIGICCPTVFALQDLWDLCIYGRLRIAALADFVTKKRLQRFNLKDFDIHVNVDVTDYWLVWQALAGYSTRHGNKLTSTYYYFVENVISIYH